MTDVAPTTAAAPAKVSAKSALRQLLENNKSAVGASLPSGYSQDRFVRLLLTAANTNPALFRCEPTSFLAAGIGAAQLGLEPNDARGLAYLIPYGNKCQLVIGYKGMIDLARRSGMVSTINVFPVYEGDQFTYSLGLEPTLNHVPADGEENPDKLTHVYAVARVNGDPQFVVMTRKQIDRVMSQSQGAKSKQSPWNSHYVEMALKTAVRRLCKLLPQTVELAAAEQIDGQEMRLDALPLGHLAADEDDIIDVESEEL